MSRSVSYRGVALGLDSLGTVIPSALAEDTAKALGKLNEALGGDVSGYVAQRLRMSLEELRQALSTEQVDGVALAMYNIEQRGQSLIIGDQTGIGKGRQAAAMLRYGLLSGYLPIFFTERYTLFSDMYRDCKALGVKEARPLIVNAGVSVVDFDEEEIAELDWSEDIWSPSEEKSEAEQEAQIMSLYQMQYKTVYEAPKKKVLQEILYSGDIPRDRYDYLMISYSQLKDTRRDTTRLSFLLSLCHKHRVLFIFDEAHRSSSVMNSKKASVITQAINLILRETPQTQCVFLSATFAKRPENLLTFMRRTELSDLATEATLEKALLSGGVPMQEYVSASLAAKGQMIRREHSSEGLPLPIYTYLDEDLVLHSKLFDKVMFWFRELLKLSTMLQQALTVGQMNGLFVHFSPYPLRSQLFYINKVVLLALKAQRVAEVAIQDVRQGRSVVIGMSDTLECILSDLRAEPNGSLCGDISSLLCRLADKCLRSTNKVISDNTLIYDYELDEDDEALSSLISMLEELRHYHQYIIQGIKAEVFHLPASPIDVIRQIITAERFTTPGGMVRNICFEECTGRSHQLEYLSPEGNDDYKCATLQPRRRRHSNQIFNDFQNNKIDVMLINACGAIGASAHAIATQEVPDAEVRQRKMLIVQNDLDVNIDQQKRGRINRTGQRPDLPPLYEYIITAIPSEKRLNMMLRAKLRSLSAHTAAHQDQDKEQADFVDINNKYGNEIASNYLEHKKELALLLGLKGRITASGVLARIAMLSVDAQREIIDDLMTGYMALEAELRRINQWDLEREFRDFEAQFVREELFTTTQGTSGFGACSYLSTYLCRHKTFPYSYDRLHALCAEARATFGEPYPTNKALQGEVRRYYTERSKQVRERFAERRRLLYADTERILLGYCPKPTFVAHCLKEAQAFYGDWSQHGIEGLDQEAKAKQILRKLIAYSNEYNHLLEREQRETKSYAAEKKRLIEILSLATIGEGYSNINDHLAGEEVPQRVIAVLKDIRFDKEEAKRFLPSRVELVFALSAVYTELSINLVHNDKWSNYERVKEILTSRLWTPDEAEWSREIAEHNNRVVERKIVTGNILGAYVHPSIASLKPRFISFSLEGSTSERPLSQHGLLLPLNEAKLREVLSTISLPLGEGLCYAHNSHTSYTITGIGVDFSLLPYREGEEELTFVLSVRDQHSKTFGEEPRFSKVRVYFNAQPMSSIYQHSEEIRSKKRLMHYTTDRLTFDSEAFQSIIQTLVQLDAVIIVPRDQLTVGEVRSMVSRSELSEQEPWPQLDWQSGDNAPAPTTDKKLLRRISTPDLAHTPKGEAVLRHSRLYLLARETMELSGQALQGVSMRQYLRAIYLRWKDPELSRDDHCLIYWRYQALIDRELKSYLEGREQATTIVFSSDLQSFLQAVLDSEYLDRAGQSLARFEEEMLFLSPSKEEVQAFLDTIPLSPSLESMRICLEDYLKGKTQVIHNPEDLSL